MKEISCIELEKMKAESAVDTYWSKHMSLYGAEMPQEFKDDWVNDLLKTSDLAFYYDDDVRMSFQRMVMTTIWDFYYNAHSH